MSHVEVGVTTTSPDGTQDSGVGLRVSNVSVGDKRVPTDTTWTFIL